MQFPWRPYPATLPPPVRQFYRFPRPLPELRKILKPHPGQVCHATKNPSADGVRSRKSPARSALILVGNITYTEKRTRRAFVLPCSTQDIKDGSGRHVTYHARLQQILALVVAQCFKWKLVQGPVRRNDESCCCLRFGDRFQECPEKAFRGFYPRTLCAYFIDKLLR